MRAIASNERARASRQRHGKHAAHGHPRARARRALCWSECGLVVATIVYPAAPAHAVVAPSRAAVRARACIPEACEAQQH